MSMKIDQIEFGEIAEFRNGLNFDKDSHGKGCLLVGVSDFKNRFTPNYELLDEINPTGISKDDDYLQKGDILFVRSNGNKNLVGRSLFIDSNFKALYSGFCIRARLTSNKILPRFCAYFAKTDIFRSLISSTSIGTNIQNLNQGILSSIKIPLLSMNTQTKIVKVLSDIDAKIELNNKINAELEAMAKLIYDYWFVQFDFPDADGKPYKSSGGKMVFNEVLKREIPAGWEVKKLGTVLNTELGGTPSTKIKSYWEGNISWLNSGEIADFPIIKSEEHITKEAIDNSATTLMPIGTCVLSITRHLRPSILAIDSCANQSVVGIFESNTLKSSYIYPYLINEIPRLMSLRTGAQQPHINKGIVDNSWMINPLKDILYQYYRQVNCIYKQIINNALQNQKLVELRDWLLPMLMNGQVSVGEAEQKVREATQ